MARRLGAAPSKVGFGVVLRKLARDIFKNWYGRRELHPDHLVGNEIVSY
jgi:hypothetical protein